MPQHSHTLAILDRGDFDAKKYSNVHWTCEKLSLKAKYRFIYSYVNMLTSMLEII